MTQRSKAEQAIAPDSRFDHVSEFWWLRDPVTNQPLRDPFGMSFIDLAHREADASKPFSKCYFIGGKRGPIKIGHSVDPEGRLATLQAGSPVTLAILALRQGGELRERAYHQQFAHLREHGEWFERHRMIMREIKAINGRG